MTRMSDRSTSRPFEHLVLAQTGPEFVDRRWLHDEVERALRVKASRYVLVTGEPGACGSVLTSGHTWPRELPDGTRAERDDRGGPIRKGLVAARRKRTGRSQQAPTGAAPR